MTNANQIKRVWVEALRSGKYEQTTKSLFYQGRFCGLGVLCAELDIPFVESEDDNKFDTDDMQYVNTKAYLALPGLIGGKLCCDIIEMNDAGKTFEEIADYIESTITEEVTYEG